MVRAYLPVALQSRDWHPSIYQIGVVVTVLQRKVLIQCCGKVPLALRDQSEQLTRGVADVATRAVRQNLLQIGAGSCELFLTVAAPGPDIERPAPHFLVGIAGGGAGPACGAAKRLVLVVDLRQPNANEGRQCLALRNPIRELRQAQEVSGLVVAVREAKIEVRRGQRRVFDQPIQKNLAGIGLKKRERL